MAESKARKNFGIIRILLAVIFLGLVDFYGCGVVVHPLAGGVSRYAVGMHRNALESRIGIPNHEEDNWVYYLSAAGGPPPGPHTGDVFLRYPEFYVSFRHNRVDEAFWTSGIKLPEQRSFDGSMWQKASASERGVMLEDLDQRNLLKGLTKDEVQSLLGKSDKQTLDRTLSYKFGWCIIDPRTVDFILDENDMVVKTEVVCH